MCPITDTYELRDRSQEGNPDTWAPENPLIKKNRTKPTKITILHTKKETILVKTEEDPRKPWYFAHV